MIEKVSLANNEGKKKDISEVTEEEKKIALLRLDFIKSIYRYCDSRFGKDFDMSSDADFELFLDSKGVNFYFPDFLRYITCQKTTVKGYEEIKRYFDRNSDLKSFYEKLPKDFIEKIMEMDSRYNQLFAEKDSIPEMTFIHDAFMFAQLNELKSAIYDMKAELTSVLAYILLVQKNMGSNPFCKEWGFLRDTKSHDDSNISNVLYVELPGHIQPLMVHMEDMLLDGIEITDLYFPEYNGLFKGANSSGLESYLSTHVLFRLSNTPGDNQLNSLKLSKKLKKAAIDRRKKEIDKMPEGLEKRSAEKIWLRECKYYRMIEYMEAMAKDKARNIGQDI